MWAMLAIVAGVIFVMFFWNPADETPDVSHEEQRGVVHPTPNASVSDTAAPLRRNTDRSYGLRWKLRWNLIAAIPAILVGITPLYFLSLTVQGFVVFVLIVIPPFLAGLVLICFVGPLFQGNSALARAFPVNGSQHVVQITYSPRLITGVEAILDDADDYGRIWIDDVGIHFEGDSTTMSVAPTDVERCRRRSSSWRAPFAGGGIEVLLKHGASGCVSFRVVARTGKTLIGSRRASRRLRTDILQWWERQRP